MTGVRRGLIVVLEEGVYLAPWKGKPGRTPDKDQAKAFQSAREAMKAIEWARRFNSFRNARIECG